MRNEVGTRARVTPAETLRAALQARGWSVDELAWVLGCSPEAVELIQAVTVIPQTALRLEAALEITTWEWLDGVSPDDLWILSEHMAAELAGIRRRRHLLAHRRQHEDGWTPCV